MPPTAQSGTACLKHACSTRCACCVWHRGWESLGWVQVLHGPTAPISSPSYIISLTVLQDYTPFSPTNGRDQVNTSMKFGSQYGWGEQLNCLIFMTLFSYFNTAAENNKKRNVRFTSTYFCFSTWVWLMKKIQLFDLSSTPRQNSLINHEWLQWLWSWNFIRCNM